MKEYKKVKSLEELRKVSEKWTRTQRVRHFNGLRFRHRHYDLALQALYQNFFCYDHDYPPGMNDRRNLIALAGVSGSGKTTVVQAFTELLWDQYLVGREDPASVACIQTLPIGNFSPRASDTEIWRDLHTKITQAMPRYSKPDISIDLPKSLQMPEKVKEAHALEILARLLKRQDVWAVIVDEAHNQYFTGQRQPIRFKATTYKTLSLLSGTVMIMVGLFELLDLSVDDELSNRITFIEVPRYRLVGSLEDPQSDHYEYANLLQSFANWVPYPEPLDISDHYEEIHEITQGAIGLWRDWLFEAIEAKEARKIKNFTWKNVRRFAPSKERIENVGTAAVFGEQRLDNYSEYFIDNVRFRAAQDFLEIQKEGIDSNELKRILRQPRPKTVWERFKMPAPDEREES